MNKIAITNLSLYKAIVKEAHAEMSELVLSGRRPKDDGSKGWIITYDPTHASFKKSMIVIVFTCMWLEAILHITIVNRFGEAKFKEYERKKKVYEDKLKLLGINDEVILNGVSKLRTARKELVHEKAFINSGKILWGQTEAELAYKLMCKLETLLQND